MTPASGGLGEGCEEEAGLPVGPNCVLKGKGPRYVLLPISSAGQDSGHKTGIRQVPEGYAAPGDARERPLSRPFPHSKSKSPDGSPN